MSIKHFSSHVEFVFTPSHYPNSDPISRCSLHRLTRPGIHFIPMSYHIRAVYANYYTTEAIN